MIEAIIQTLISFSKMGFEELCGLLHFKIVGIWSYSKICNEFDILQHYMGINIAKVYEETMSFDLLKNEIDFHMASKHSWCCTFSILHIPLLLLYRALLIHLELNSSLSLPVNFPVFIFAIWNLSNDSI